jgi:threonine/homoserine/homoserine lactone efflux protein
MAVFFASLLPQFTSEGKASFAALLLLGLAFCLLTLGWLTSDAVAVATAGDVLRRPRIRRAFEGFDRRRARRVRRSSRRRASFLNRSV